RSPERVISSTTASQVECPTCCSPTSPPPATYSASDAIGWPSAGTRRRSSFRPHSVLRLLATRRSACSSWPIFGSGSAWDSPLRIGADRVHTPTPARVFERVDSPVGKHVSGVRQVRFHRFAIRGLNIAHQYI